MAANDLDLLGQFAREQSQDAFTELVNRHLGLVYSAALRQVRAPHLAEDIAQSVFTNLARHAAKLSPDTNLTAWLYRATRNAAIDVIRSEARRQAREQLSLQMSAMNDNDSPAAWSHIEPLLDEAMDALDEADRTAILMRYFEKKSLSEVGAALGASEDAAQKRVSRAVERLREFLAKRKVAVGAAGLVALLSTNAVQALPAAFATTVATGAVLASATLSTSSAATTTIAIAMTTAQKVLVTVLITGAVAAGVYEGLQASRYRERVKALELQQEQDADQRRQFDKLKKERDDATVKLAQVIDENNSLKKRPADVLKLRNEVGQLKRENTEMGSKSALSKMTADPETRKMMREQQKMGIAMLYKGYFDQTQMAPDMKEKLNNLLADHVMQNVDTITTLLRDKPPKEQFDQAFAAQNASLQQDVASMLGPDGLAQFNDYSKNLVSTLTAEQFKDQMTGTDAEKAAKSQQLLQVMQSEVASAMAGANLPANYQALPIMNFANIASEDMGNQSLALLQSVYEKVAAECGSFLSADELAKFQKFAATAVSNNRMGLSLNRTMMAPIGQ